MMHRAILLLAITTLAASSPEGPQIQKLNDILAKSKKLSQEENQLSFKEKETSSKLKQLEALDRKSKALKIKSIGKDKEEAVQDETKTHEDTKQEEDKIPVVRNLKAEVKSEGKSEAKTEISKGKGEGKQSPELIKQQAEMTYSCKENGKEVLMMYINSPSKPERSRCMKAQLDQHCMPYENFPAVDIQECPNEDWQCLQDKLFTTYRDCVTQQVDVDAITTHGSSSGKSKSKVAAAVFGNWCSHYKLLQEIVRRVDGDPNFADDYPAFVMLEDDVVLDKEWSEEVLKDWVNNYNGTWDLVQLDPFGPEKGEADVIGEFRGKKVMRPSWKGSYYGYQAVLVKTSSARQILRKIDTMNVVPIDWLNKYINDYPEGISSLAWHAGISRNPEDTQYGGKQISLPEGCSQAVLKTSIG